MKVFTIAGKQLDRLSFVNDIPIRAAFTTHATLSKGLFYKESMTSNYEAARYVSSAAHFLLICLPVSCFKARQ